uniref:Uncharacterized protein n=2 Tax=Branchiostoma floridae TaxID=7739 RepID=C3ZUI6_BRAFL|eukprot:XP_002587814.1 hypothetical protein BRAFLDRAFT_92263 [Branchiostoma floridae]
MECLTDLSSPCVPSSWICDDIPDCLDGRDEQGCVQGVPKHCFFTCRNNVTCLPSRQLGDGHQDCADGEDERLTDVEHALGLKWGSCSYNCSSVYGNASCVPDAFSCDGDVDCWGAEDEQGCENAEQDAGGTDGCQTFTCDLPGLLDPICVPPHQICDGYPDCVSGKDEQGCSVTTQTATSSSSGQQSPAAGEKVTDTPTRGQETQEGPTTEPTSGQGLFEDKTG